jgi:hypothetical protein
MLIPAVLLAAACHCGGPGPDSPPCPPPPPPALTCPQKVAVALALIVRGNRASWVEWVDLRKACLGIKSTEAHRQEARP